MTGPVNTHAPLVSVVIATCGRPEMLRNAIRSIVGQEYSGAIEVIVVFDRIEIDPLTDIDPGSNRTLRLLRNSHTPGLAGGWNTGILAAEGAYIGFCDDDDEWRPSKLRMQLTTWAQNPSAVAMSSGICIQTDNDSRVRLPPGRVTFADFLKSRVTEVHPSTMLFRREDLLGRIGLVDERLPASYGEDYDLLLRATRHGDIYSVTEPLVLVRWDRPSFFAGRWENIAAGLTYLLRKFPEFGQSNRGTARIAGQVAFAHAALGNSRQAKVWAWSALSRDPLQLRAYAALLIGARLIPASTLLDLVQRRGRGL